MTCLCVFAGAASGTSESYKTNSFTLAQKLTRQGYRFIYGGGSTGLMGAFADGVIDQGGQIEGVIPQFLEDREVGHRGLHKLTVTTTMHERKTAMYDGADGFLILPGGIGTLDETMEVLTWRQLGRLSGPVFAYSPDRFWDPMRQMIQHLEQEGFIHSGGIGSLYWADTTDDVVKHCQAAFV